MCSTPEVAAGAASVAARDLAQKHLESPFEEFHWDPVVAQHSLVMHLSMTPAGYMAVCFVKLPCYLNFSVLLKAPRFCPCYSVRLKPNKAQLKCMQGYCASKHKPESVGCV